MAFLRTHVLALLTCSLVFVVAVGCGDDGATDGGTDTGTVDSGGGDTGAGDTGTGDTSVTDSGGGDSAAMDSSTDGSTDGGDGGVSDLVITEVSAAAWANCMPIVPADPLRFVLELRYDNAAGSAPATAIITSATLTFDDGATSTTDADFDVEMVMVAAGAAVTQTHIKTTSTPIVPSCSICDPDRTLAYDLVFDVGGDNARVTGSTSFDCTY